MTVLDSLSPDQRAVLQLILQQGRSYEDLADLLRIDRDKVADRARNGLDRLCPPLDDLDLDDQDEVSDFILGQQTVSEREATRRFLASSPPGREWAHTVVEALREIARDELPEIPAAAEPAPTTAPVTSEPAPTAATMPGTAPTPAAPGTGSPYAPPPGVKPPRAPTTAAPAVEELPEEPPSSKLGGIVLVGCVAVILVAVIVLLVSRGGDDPDPAATTPATETTAETTPSTTATTPAADANQIGQVTLRGSGAARSARGLAQVLEQDGRFAFALVAEQVPESGSEAAYAVWLVAADGKADRLGYAPAVTAEGLLQTSGELPENASRFRDIVVSRETRETAKPTNVILRGRLPAELRKATRR